MFINNPMNVSTFGLIRLRASPRTTALIILLPPAPMTSLIICCGLRLAANTRERSANISNACANCQGVEILNQPPAFDASTRSNDACRLRVFQPLLNRLICRVVNRRELDYLEPAFAGRSGHLYLVAFRSPHKPAPYRGGSGYFVLRYVGIFRHHQLVSD